MAKKILVVDDEPDILHEVSFILQKKGYEVIPATNGQEALDCIEEKHPDLVILDLWLPLIDGIEVGRRVKADEALRDIPIVLLTASVDNIEGKVKEARADDYLLKPFDYMELLEKVKRFVG
jgi:CheY-like chemotaxis protein